MNGFPFTERDMRKQFKWWLQRIGNLATGIIVGAVASLLAAVIIAIYPIVGEPTHKFLVVNAGWLITIAILIISSIGIIVYSLNAWRREREIWNSKLNDLDGQLKTLSTNLGWGDLLLDVVDSLLILLPGLITTKNLHKFMHDLLADTTKVITNTVPGVYGASLYLPEGKDYLKIWEAYQVPEDSRKNASCYIGPNPDVRRGVAGECFCEKAVLVAHQTDKVDKNKDVIFDRESYLHFGKQGTYPAFASFICVPVKAESGDCLGVLCFDSLHLTVFDNIGLQKALQRLGQIVAHMFILYDGLEKQQTV